MILHGSWPAVQHGSGAGTAPAGDGGDSSGTSRGLGGEVVELALLLTSAEAAALESAAQAKGMTVARLLRSVIRESLEGINHPPLFLITSVCDEDVSASGDASALHGRVESQQRR